MPVTSSRGKALGFGQDGTGLVQEVNFKRGLNSRKKATKFWFP